MRSISFILAGMLFSAQNFAQTSTAGNMFRNNPSHSGFINTSYNLVYDTRSWSFFAGAPIRSTPLLNLGNLYFGDAKGDFFCIEGRTGKLKWHNNFGEPIHSSAAANKGRIFFSDNRQSIYALNEKNGSVLWKYNLGKKIEYPWRFDYYYSSPLLYGDNLYIGGDDGYVYALNQQTGNVIWKFQCKGIVRSTPTLHKNTLLLGDTEATFYAIDIQTGKEKWKFSITGDSLKNENFGYDRRAITSSATISRDKVLFGARDGYLYALSVEDGKLLWKMDHNISWVISTPAVKDTFVVAGTSDGRFVQAIHLDTGKEIWKYRTPQAMWSSPLINNDLVYAAGFDGQIYCLDLYTGKRISQFSTNNMILSSPVIQDSLLYVGADDGYLYALKGRDRKKIIDRPLQRFVFFDAASKIYFRNGSDSRIRSYMESNGFAQANADTLSTILSNTLGAKNTVVVFASCYFPRAITENGPQSLLRKFLDNGGRIVLPGFNSMLYKIDEKTRQPYAFNVPLADSVLGLDFGPNDTRAFGGLFPCLVTEKGREFNLPEFWISGAGIDPTKVDMVLGKNEYGLASAFVKFYSNKGAFVQCYLHPDLPVNLDALVKLAEWEL